MTALSRTARYLWNFLMCKKKNSLSPIVFPTLTTPSCVYEVFTDGGLPLFFEKILLFSLVRQVLDNNIVLSREIITTFDQVAADVFPRVKKYNEHHYKKIQLAFEKLKAIHFCARGNDQVEYFSMIDVLVLDHVTKDITIIFSTRYLQTLVETKFYSYIIFDEYRKLRSTIAIRLYDFLSHVLHDRTTVFVPINDLIRGMDIRNQKYISKILIQFKSATRNINKNTYIKFEFSYDKQTQVCQFTRIAHLDT